MSVQPSANGTEGASHSSGGGAVGRFLRRWLRRTVFVVNVLLLAALAVLAVNPVGNASTIDQSVRSSSSDTAAMPSRPAAR